MPPPPYTYELAGVLLQGVIGNRPIASTGRYWYFATDTLVLSKSDGSTWTDIADLSVGGGVASVTAGDTSVVVDNTDPTNPTIETGTLDVIATDHPPAADWSNNSQKITDLADGVNPQDAATVAQLGSGADAVPIGDPTGYTTSIAYTDPVSGNPVTVMTFPGDTSVAAWGVSGDAFPRTVLRVSPNNSGVLALGDGTIDPTTAGALLYYAPGAGAYLYTLDGTLCQVFVGVPDAVVGAINGTQGPFKVGDTLSVGNNAIFQSAAGDPNGVYAGNVGDRFFRTDYTGLPLTNDYVCTVAGAAGAASWVGYA